MNFQPGKLDPKLLAELLGGLPARDDRVLIRPAVGRDVCALRMGETCLVAKTDPITFATDRIGSYVVHVNANDIATVGARPKWFLVTALLPEAATDEALVRHIWEELAGTLDGIGCELCGGHTEITVGLDRPILVGFMLGEVPLGRLVDKSSVRPGDLVLLTRGVPIEGTAIMAQERGDELRRHFPGAQVERGRAFLDDPGISVLAEAMLAVEEGEVHAMHDPTEGGVLTGLWELAEAADCGLLVHEERIPVLEPGGAFCRHFGLDPLGTIASGALLICAPPDDAGRIRRAIEATGVPCQVVGEIRPRGEGVQLLRNGMPVPFRTYARDEITRLFAAGRSASV